MSDRLESVRAWIADVHPHARHLERTLDWLVDLDPEAATATRIAAVTHDIERTFPDPGSQWIPARDLFAAGLERIDGVAAQVAEP
jgi:hypothetical protein